eukprot:386817_1
MAEDMFATVTNTIQQEMNKIMKTEIGKFQKEFEPKMNEVILKCQNDLDGIVNKYNEKRKKIADKMDDNLNRQANDRMTELRTKLDLEVGKIEKELFNDPKSLLKQITEERKKLEYQRQTMKEETKNWGSNEKKIAKYLGFGHFEDNKSNENNIQSPPLKKRKLNSQNAQAIKGLDEDDELEDNHNKKECNQRGEDWITINVDGRIFGTYRSTLTQVKGSILALMFGMRSDMVHSDSNGVYYLDRNSSIFATVLEILRRRGVMPSNFELTPELQAELMELGLYKAFFRDEFEQQALLLGASNEGIGKLCFQTFRSKSSSSSNYIKWDIKGLQSGKVSTYFQINHIDKSEIIIKTAGWYRLVSRIVINTDTGSYAAIVVNGDNKHYNYNSGYSSQYYKSYNFNEILKFKKGDKIKIYTSHTAYAEETSSYLCLETIPSNILPQIGVYKST